MTQVHDCCPSRQGIGKEDRRVRGHEKICKDLYRANGTWLLTPKRVQDALRDIGVVEIADDAVVVVRRVLDSAVVLDRGLDREVDRVERVERHDVTAVECVVPGGHRRWGCQRPELVSNRAHRKGRADRHEKRDLQLATVGAQDAVRDDGAQRMADDYRRLLGQLGRHYPVDLVAYTGPRRIEENVAREGLKGLLVD